MELSENVNDVFTGVDWNYLQLDHDRFVLSRSVDNLIVNTIPLSKALLLVRVTLRNMRCISNSYHVPNFRVSPVRRVSARRPLSSANAVKEKVVN